MKLSETTLEILSNFSSINPSLIVSQGSSLQTNNNSGMRAFATLEDSFPRDFAVYDLKQFLSFLDLLGKDSELVFENDHVGIGDKSKGHIKFYYSSSRVIKTLQPVHGTAAIETAIVTRVDSDTMKKTLKAASTLRSEYVAFTSSGTMKAFNPDNQSGDSFEISVDMQVQEESSFLFVLSVDNMKKLMTDNYDIELDKRGLARFKGERGMVQYFVGLEKEHSSWQGRSL